MSYDENRISDQIDGGISEREQLLKELAFLKNENERLEASEIKWFERNAQLEGEVSELKTKLSQESFSLQCCAVDKNNLESEHDKLRDDCYQTIEDLRAYNEELRLKLVEAKNCEHDSAKILSLESELLKAKERITELEIFLPRECIAGQSEVKFCHYRQGDGGKCYHCK